MAESNEGSGLRLGQGIWGETMWWFLTYSRWLSLTECSRPLVGHQTWACAHNANKCLFVLLMNCSVFSLVMYKLI